MELAQVGRIQIGEKSGEEKRTKGGTIYRVPSKLDYIQVKTMERDKSEGFSEHQNNFKLNKEVHAAIGDNPTELDAILPFDDPEKILTTEYKFFAGRKCICHGDGVKAERTDKNGEIKEVDCNPDDCPYYNQDRAPCAPSSILSVFLLADPHFGGIYKYRSKGIHACSALMSFLASAHSSTGGKLAGMHVKLKMVAKQTEDYGVVRYLTMVVNGDVHKSFLEYTENEVQRRAQLGYNIKQLETHAESSGLLLDNDPEDIVIDEFNPDLNEEVNGDIKDTLREEPEAIIEQTTKQSNDGEEPTQRISGNLF